MLVMTRAAGESVLIGDDLLTVVRVTPSVRIAVREGRTRRTHQFRGGNYKTNQSLSIGSCRVVLMAVARKEVTLGFDAPKSVVIVRSELLPLDETSNPDPDQR